MCPASGTTREATARTPSGRRDPCGAQLKCPQVEVSVICNRLHFHAKSQKTIGCFIAACQYIELAKSRIKGPDLISGIA